MTDTSAHNFACTASNIPPEKWKDPALHASKKFDVYSFSILVWELFANQPPYNKTLIGMLLLYFHYNIILWRLAKDKYLKTILCIQFCAVNIKGLTSNVKLISTIN